MPTSSVQEAASGADDHAVGTRGPQKGEMAMRHGAAVAFAIGLLAGGAQAELSELCVECRAGFYTTDVGKCAVCAGHTSSGAFKLCSKCGTKLRQCKHCRAKLPAAPKPKPTPKPPPKLPPKPPEGGPGESPTE